MKKLSIAAAACLIASASAIAQEGEIDAAELKAKSPDVLKGPAIQSLVSGKTFADETKNSARRIELSKDGAIAARSSVSGSKGFGKSGEGYGTWRVDGDKLCLEIQWKTSDEKWCRPVWKAGEQHYIVIGSADKQRARPFKAE